MGRGRAKAKQTKVARALKYQTFDPNLDALRRELGHEDGNGHASEAEDAEVDDPYAAYVSDDDEDEDDAPVRR